MLIDVKPKVIEREGGLVIMSALSAAGGADMNHIWYGRVSQRFRSEWQPVWINVTKNTLSSYKSEVFASVQDCKQCAFLSCYAV